MTTGHSSSRFGGNRSGPRKEDDVLPHEAPIFKYGKPLLHLHRNEVARGETNGNQHCSSLQSIDKQVECVDDGLVPSRQHQVNLPGGFVEHQEAVPVVTRAMLLLREWNTECS